MRCLFVCSGNICRSPLAEVFARKLFAERGIAAEVASAGTLGFHGFPADPLAVEVAARNGMDLRGHRSRPLSREILSWADTILVMEPEHEDAVHCVAPEAAPKVRRLWEYGDSARERGGIADPIGGDLEVFEQCRDEILECLEGWLRSTLPP